MCFTLITSHAQINRHLFNVKYLTCSYTLTVNAVTRLQPHRNTAVSTTDHAQVQYQPQAQIASSDIRPKPSVSMPSFNRRWSGLLSSRGNTSIMATYRNVPASTKAMG